uniref:Uncharacterized protein n=1 Tax=Oryza glumipatula TaxID=40148 RepID=A0A0E0BGU6_9ORYZ
MGGPGGVLARGSGLWQGNVAGMEEVLRNGADMASTTLIWTAAGGAAHRHLQGEWEVVRLLLGFEG